MKLQYILETLKTDLCEKTRIKIVRKVERRSGGTSGNLGRIKRPFKHLLQEDTVALLTWWAGIFEPVFNNLKNM